MRIIFLSDIATGIMDVLAWIIFHLSIGYWSSRIPIDFFNPQHPFYLPRKWEQSGEIYQKIFHVRDWKKYIPSGAKVYAHTFKIKHLVSYDPGYVERWLKESCRAELCHWAMILPGFIFFLWNSVGVGWWMVIYAVANNMVPIIVQRYNRPRVRKLLTRLQRIAPRSGETYVNFEQSEAFSHSYR